MNMSKAATDMVLERREGRVLWLVLNRPEKANALTVGMSQRLTELLRAAAEDEEVSAVVISAAGEKIFCAGVDVREVPDDGDMAEQRARRSRATAELQDTLIDAPIPVIVALNGAAIGAGAMMALIADACVAAEHATLSLPEIDMGIPTFSGASILTVVGGRSLAVDLIQTGRRLRAGEAASKGLIAETGPAEGLAAIAQAHADELAGKKRDTFALNKAWMNRGLKEALETARQEHAAHRQRTAGTEDVSNG